MAFYRKLPSGLWRAEVFKQGVRASDSFQTKAMATAWATQLEAEIMARKRGQVVRRSLRLALERYAAEVSPTKKNDRWEKTRVAFFCSEEFGLPFVDKNVDDVTADDLGRWRDDRLKAIKGSTINRDMNLLSAVFTTCVKEWGYASKNPIADTRRPADPRARDRLISWREIRGILRALDWHMGKPETLQQQAGFAFLMSLHTAMRASEVLKAKYSGGVAMLSDTKNGEQRRVPLSPRAQRLSRLCPRFTITGPSLDALFRKARAKAGLDGFTYHDSRGTALTRMARRVDVLQLAKISGHKDINLLSNTYYRETAESIGSRLR
jgi:integrase